MTNDTSAVSNERSELAEKLAKQRSFLRQTVQGITDEQAVQHTTVSELCLGGIIKHVSAVEYSWADFIERGPAAMGAVDSAAMEEHAATFRVLPGETLGGLLDSYGEVALGTEKLLFGLESLDASQPLPDAPWFEPGARWSARSVFLHILAETAHHCGHADIIREALDGAKTMG